MDFVSKFLLDFQGVGPMEQGGSTFQIIGFQGPGTRPGQGFGLRSHNMPRNRLYTLLWRLSLEFNGNLPMKTCCLQNGTLVG